MSPNEYRLIVAGLFKHGSQIRDDLPQISNVSLSRLHAAIGLVGECIEMHVAGTKEDDENFVEELGDIAFYLEALVQHTWESSFTGEPRTNLIEIAGDILDFAKKECIYAQPLNQELQHKYEQVVQEFKVSFIEFLEECTDLTLEEVQSINVAKLAKRYPGLKYSNKAAEERADKHEGS